MTRTRIETDGDERDDEEPSADADPETVEDDYDHLKSLDDGAGCAEVWEHLSDNRDD